MEETPWFLPTDTPVRVGAYKTKHRATDGRKIEGYSYWSYANSQLGGWGLTCESPEKARHYKYPGVQQSKAWCGLTEETK